jgi:hypothetical protein
LSSSNVKSKSTASSVSSDAFTEQLSSMTDFASVFAGMGSAPPPRFACQGRNMKHTIMLKVHRCNTISIADMLEQFGIDVVDANTIAEDWEMFLDIFCTEGRNFDVAYIKGEFKELRLMSTSAHKLCMFFKTLVEDTM